MDWRTARCAGTIAAERGYHEWAVEFDVGDTTMTMT
jgi:hypothetical protein